MKIHWLPLVLCLLAAACTDSTEPAGQAEQTESSTSAAPTSTAPQDPVKHVDPEAAAKLLEENKEVLVLDVRTPDEFAAGHIAGATNIDFMAPDFAQRIAALDKSKPYIVHCASGRRSTQSLDIFKEQEFKEIYHLDGGLKAWQNAGNPVQQ